MGLWPHSPRPQSSPPGEKQEETMSGAKNGNADAGARPPPPPQQQQQQPGPPVPGAPTVTLIRTATATAINAEKEGHQQQQQQRGARPFDAPASSPSDVGQPPSTPAPAAPLSTAAADALTPPPFKPYARQTRINWAGSAAFVFYLGALAFYLWVRITKTLDLGKYTAVRGGRKTKTGEKGTFDAYFFRYFWQQRLSRLDPTFLAPLSLSSSLSLPPSLAQSKNKHPVRSRCPRDRAPRRHHRPPLRSQPPPPPGGCDSSSDGRRGHRPPVRLPGLPRPSPRPLLQGVARHPQAHRRRRSRRPAASRVRRQDRVPLRRRQGPEEAQVGRRAQRPVGGLRQRQAEARGGDERYVEAFAFAFKAERERGKEERKKGREEREREKKTFFFLSQPFCSQPLCFLFVLFFSYYFFL